MWLYCSFIYDPAGKCCLGGRSRKNHKQGQRAIKALMQVLQSVSVCGPHNSQPHRLSQASMRTSAVPKRMMVSATVRSVMPRGGHLVNALHPGRHHWDELTAGFSMSPAGKKSISQGPGTVGWQSSAYFSEFQTHPNPTPPPTLLHTP